MGGGTWNSTYHCQVGMGRPVWGEAHGTVRTTVKLVWGGLYGGRHMEQYVPLSSWSGEACMGGGTWNSTYHCQVGMGRPVWGEAHGTVRTTVKLVRGGLYGGRHMEQYVPLSSWYGEACMGGGTWNSTYHCQVGQGRPVWGEAHGTVRTTVKLVWGGLYGGGTWNSTYHCQVGMGRPVWGRHMEQYVPLSSWYGEACMGEAHGIVRTTVKLVWGGLYGGRHMEQYVPLSSWYGEACMGGGTWNSTYHCQVGMGTPVWGEAHGTVRTTVKLVWGGLYGGRHMEQYVPLSSWSGDACMGGGTWNSTYHCQVGRGMPVWGEAHGVVRSQHLLPDTVSVLSASSCNRQQQLTHTSVQGAYTGYRAHTQGIITKRLQRDLMTKTQ